MHLCWMLCCYQGDEINLQTWSPHTKNGILTAEKTSIFFLVFWKLLFFLTLKKEKICSWWSLHDYNQLWLIQTFNFSGKSTFFQLLFPELKCYSRTTRAVCRQSGGTAAERFSAFVSRPWWRHHRVQPAINSVMHSSCIHLFISSSSVTTFCFLTFMEGSEYSVFVFPKCSLLSMILFLHILSSELADENSQIFTGGRDTKEVHFLLPSNPSDWGWGLSAVRRKPHSERLRSPHSKTVPPAVL